MIYEHTLDQQIVNLYQSGWSFKRIIAHTGKSLNYIRKRLRDAGVRHRPMGLPKGHKVSEKQRETLKRIRVGKKPALGMRHSEEARRKMSESRKGSNNGRWIDGRKRTPYPPQWTKGLRREIRERQNYRCIVCFSLFPEGLHVHHIDHNKTNCSDTNLVALCYKCHGRVHRKKERDKWEMVFLDYIQRLKS